MECLLRIAFDTTQTPNVSSSSEVFTFYFIVTSNLNIKIEIKKFKILARSFICNCFSTGQRRYPTVCSKISLGEEGEMGDNTATSQVIFNWQSKFHAGKNK